MTNIAFLGLGAMGSRMAANLLKFDFTVSVWNRSPGPDETLKLLGAAVAMSISMRFGRKFTASLDHDLLFGPRPPIWTTTKGLLNKN